MIANPIGVAGVENPEESTVGIALLSLIILLGLVALVSLVLRFRRSRGEERQQLKWFTYAGALLPLAVLGDALPAPLGNVVFAVPIVFLAVAAGIAVLRYRLYDIDRLINRTLVYGLLTALLAGVTPASSWSLGRCSVESAGILRAGRSLALRSPWPPCSSRPAAASKRLWTGASTGAAMTRQGRSTGSAPVSATRLTWTRCRRSCLP